MNIATSNDPPCPTACDDLVTAESRYAAVEPVYRGSARIADYGTKARTGMTMKLVLTGADEGVPHPCKGLRCGRLAGENASGHRLHVVVTQPGSTGDRCLLAGEIMLTWWSEDCTNGMTASFRLGCEFEERDRHPLSGCHAGLKDGDVVFLAFWAVDDAEGLQQPERARREKRSWSTLSPTQQSNILCRDSLFQKWCSIHAAALGIPAEESKSAMSVAYVRLRCGVASRSDLSHDTADGMLARQRWTVLMREFMTWKNEPPPRPA